MKVQLNVSAYMTHSCAQKQQHPPCLQRRENLGLENSRDPLEIWLWSIWDLAEIMPRPGGDHAEILLRSFCAQKQQHPSCLQRRENLGLEIPRDPLRSCWDLSEILLRSCSDHAGIMLRFCWDPFSHKKQQHPHCLQRRENLGLENSRDPLEMLLRSCWGWDSA